MQQSIDDITASLSGFFSPRGRAVVNNPAPLLLFAVVAVAAALAVIAVLGFAAAWLMYCKAFYGPASWPAVGVPDIKNGFYYFGCMVPQ